MAKKVKTMDLIKDLVQPDLKIPQQEQEFLSSLTKDDLNAVDIIGVAFIPDSPQPEEVPLVTAAYYSSRGWFESKNMYQGGQCIFLAHHLFHGPRGGPCSDLVNDPRFESINYSILPTVRDSIPEMKDHLDKSSNPDEPLIFNFGALYGVQRKFLVYTHETPTSKKKGRSKKKGVDPKVAINNLRVNWPDENIPARELSFLEKLVKGTDYHPRDIAGIAMFEEKIDSDWLRFPVYTSTRYNLDEYNFSMLFRGICISKYRSSNVPFGYHPDAKQKYTIEDGFDINFNGWLEKTKGQKPEFVDMGEFYGIKNILACYKID